MSPRKKSPDSKDKQYRLRMSDEEKKMLEYCCEVLGLTKAEVFRQGVKEMYQKAQEKK